MKLIFWKILKSTDNKHTTKLCSRKKDCETVIPSCNILSMGHMKQIKLPKNAYRAMRTELRDLYDRILR